MQLVVNEYLETRCLVADQETTSEGAPARQRPACPDCGAPAVSASGCLYCPSCGWGRCG